jgi:protoporphyrinogen/coproporphyrinogen III oxidase
MKTVAIIGAGVGGLSTAYRVLEQARAAEQKVHITIFEAGPQVGGVVASSARDGFVLEHGPDSIIRTKPAGMKLINDLGLSDKVEGTQEHARQSFIARGRRLLPVPDGLYLLAPAKFWPFVTSPIVSPLGKLRMAMDLFLPKRAADKEDESLADFVRRRLGREALARIAQPLIGGIYSADPENLSIRATMPQFIEMEQKHRSLILAMRQRAREQANHAAENARGPRYGLFTTLSGGLGELIKGLHQRLADQVTIKNNTAVESVTRDKNGGYTLGLPDGYFTSDAVVIAGPAHVAAKLVKPLDQVLSYKLATIPYTGVATINMAWHNSQIPRMPVGAGFVVPAVEGRTLLACTFAHHKYAGRAPQDHVLLRGFVGGGLHEAVLERDDRSIIDGVLRDLRDLLGVQGTPLFTTVHRWPKTMAQYVLGHTETVQVIRAREHAFPGFALVGNGYEGVGIPDIAAQAELAAERIITRSRSAAGHINDATTRAETA